MLIMFGIIFVVPLDIVFSYFNREDITKFQNMFTEKYEDAALEFVDDYDRENPVTQLEGWKYALDLLEKKSLISTDKVNDIKEQINVGDYFMPGVKSIVNNQVHTEKTTEIQAEDNVNAHKNQAEKLNIYKNGLFEIKSLVAKHQKPKAIHKSYAFKAPEYVNYYVNQTSGFFGFGNNQVLDTNYAYNQYPEFQGYQGQYHQSQNPAINYGQNQIQYQDQTQYQHSSNQPNYQQPQLQQNYQYPTVQPQYQQPTIHPQYVEPQYVDPQYVEPQFQAPYPIPNQVEFSQPSYPNMSGIPDPNYYNPGYPQYPQNY